MNLDILKAPDPSGKMSKESYMAKFHAEEHEFITSYCSDRGMGDLPFKEKTYICLNGMQGRPACKNPKCGGDVKFINSTLGYREYCSTGCIGSDPAVIKSKQDKSMAKWGTKTPAESEEVKSKMMETNRRLYGGNSPMSSESTKEKSRMKLMRNWGVENPAHSHEILERRIESFKRSGYKESYKKAMMDRHGVDHHWKVKEIHDKTIDGFYRKYGERIEGGIKAVFGERFNFVRFERDQDRHLSFGCGDCGREFKILPYQFYYRLNSRVSICTECYPISKSNSLSQEELLKFISENYGGEIQQNVKSVIRPYEIDIYLPEMRIGFEFNGVWWHSDKFRDERYHLKKHEASVEAGVKLYSIWEDDWAAKRRICESFVMNKIGATDRRIQARKCEIAEVGYSECRHFLDENHFQGDCRSSVRLGLIHQGELVSVMTFSRPRLPLNRSEKSRSGEGRYELTRFCNKTNTTVQGGASRLFNHFRKKYSPEIVETYSDNLISDGSIYRKLGFANTHTSKPGYWYAVNGMREHRFNWRKQKLVKLGHDPEKSEQEIMNEMGHYRVWNAGNKKWVFKK